MNVPTSVTDITPAWMTSALQHNGFLVGKVADFEIEPVAAGVGLMGELARFRLVYEGESDLPENLMVKCAAQQPENLAVAKLLDFYNREANFYNRMRDSCPLKTAQYYYSDVNQKTYDFVLIMEDLGALSVKDQLQGATAEEVMMAVGKISEMHAQYWGKTAEQGWMYDVMSAEEATKLRTYVYMPSLEPALEKFDDNLTTEQKVLLKTVGENYQRYWAGSGCPDTFIHGDYRQDNMLYQSNNPEATVIDWQICGYGKGIFDIAYFMCQSVDSKLRRQIEMDVLAHYREQLQAKDISYGEDECISDYRRYVLGCLVYPVTVCGSLDLSNERGHALGVTMLTRNLRAAEELDCMNKLS